MDDEPKTGGIGLFAGAAQLLKTLRDVVENRLKLFLLELKEERLRLMDAFLLAVVGIICALMTLIVLTFAVIVAFWDGPRLLVLTLITLAYAVSATVAFVKLRIRLRQWRAFSETLEQLKKDRSCLGD